MFTQTQKPRKNQKSLLVFWTSHPEINFNGFSFVVKIPKKNHKIVCDLEKL